MITKQIVHNEFLEMLLQKIATQQVVQKDLMISAANETKSTAGDKYETALAMLQIEQKQVSKILGELNIQLGILNTINLENKFLQVNLGSLVRTNYGYFYISTALGKINIDNENIFSLSTKSPLGILLFGKMKNDSFNFNGLNYSVLQIL